MSTSAQPPSARSPWPWRIGVVVAVVVVALVVWLVVRDDGGTGASPPATMPAASPPSTTPSDTPSDTPTQPTAGCEATEDGTPDDADSRDVVDVDGDGEADTAWLTGGADRRIGITTASGATFCAAIDSASPQRASAVVNLVATSDDRTDGTAPVALVDTGREVLLFSAAGCRLTATSNADGDPYTFDKGFTGYGTGVGCTDADGGLRLAGLDASSDDDGTTFTVTRTFVDLAADATSATNGDTETVADDAAADDPVVVTAQETSCGELVAGKDGPVEPQ